jgi:hypothetical protein
MFGHQDDDSQQPQDGTYIEPPAGAIVDQTAPGADNSYVAAPPAAATPSAPLSSEPLLEAQAADGYVGGTTLAASISDPTPSESATNDSLDTSTAPIVVSTIPATSTPPISANDLLDIKQQALQQLSPLVGQLDQSPEEKFRTTMMMIQASDNQDLIRTAYEVAGQISNEKSRAQALLDIVNEINYFTQNNTTN